VLTSVGNNKWTIQRIFLFPSNTTYIITYGQAEYSSQDTAINAVNTELTTYPSQISEATQLCSLVVKKGCTSLNNTTQATFIKTSKFGGAGTSGGMLSTTTLQGAYNNSTTPEIIIDSTRGALTLQGYNSGYDNLYEGKTSGGTTTFAVKGNGYLSATTISSPIISGGTFYGDSTYLSNLPYGISKGIGTSIFTGQTGNQLGFRSLSGGTDISLRTDDTGIIVINSTSSVGNNTSVTGFTYNNSNNVLTIKQNGGQSDLNVGINTMSGLTINGNIVVTGNTSGTYNTINTDLMIQASLLYLIQNT
jgi:hypothetical protein